MGWPDGRFMSTRLIQVAGPSAIVLRKAGFGKQVKAAIKNIKQPTATALAKGIEATFKQKSDREWRDHIETEAKKRTLKV